MRQECKKNIERVLKKGKSPKNIRCCKYGFKRLCKTERIGIEEYLICFEEDPQDCRNSLLFGGTYYCDCPVRWYIKNKLEETVMHK